MQVAMPHGSLLLAAASGQTITFAPDLPNAEPAAEEAASVAAAPTAALSSTIEPQQAASLVKPSTEPAAEGAARVAAAPAASSDASQQAASLLKPSEEEASPKALAELLLTRASATTLDTGDSGTDIAGIAEAGSAGGAGDKVPAPRDPGVSPRNDLASKPTQGGPVNPVSDDKSEQQRQSLEDGNADQNRENRAQVSFCFISACKPHHSHPPLAGRIKCCFGWAQITSAQCSPAAMARLF